MATARLRARVKYPSLSDEPMHLDEDEQEMLISSLRSRNAAQNRVFSTILFSGIAFVNLVYFSYFNTAFYPTLLSTTSFVLTLFLLYPSTSIHTFLSPHARSISDSGIELSTLWTGHGPNTGSGIPAGMSVKKWGKMPARPSSEAEAYNDPFAGQSESPLRKSLPILNALASFLLAIYAGVKCGRKGWKEAIWFGPIAVRFWVWIFRSVMVQVKVRELEDLRYTLKGA